MKAIITIGLVIIGFMAFGQIGRVKIDTSASTGKLIRVLVLPTYFNVGDCIIIKNNGVFKQWNFEEGSQTFLLNTVESKIDTKIANSQSAINNNIDVINTEAKTGEQTRIDCEQEAITTCTPKCPSGVRYKQLIKNCRQ